MQAILLCMSDQDVERTWGFFLHWSNQFRGSYLCFQYIRDFIVPHPIFNFVVDHLF